MSCPFVLRYRSMDGPERPPFGTSGRTVLNATWYYIVWPVRPLLEATSIENHLKLRAVSFVII